MQASGSKKVNRKAEEGSGEASAVPNEASDIDQFKR